MNSQISSLPRCSFTINHKTKSFLKVVNKSQKSIFQSVYRRFVSYTPHRVRPPDSRNESWCVKAYPFTPQMHRLSADFSPGPLASLTDRRPARKSSARCGSGGRAEEVAGLRDDARSVGRQGGGSGSVHAVSPLPTSRALIRLLSRFSATTMASVAVSPRPTTPFTGAD